MLKETFTNCSFPVPGGHALTAADVQILTDGEATDVAIGVMVEVALAGPQLGPHSQLIVPAQLHHVRRLVAKKN
jgi:hypothetical protein